MIGFCLDAASRSGEILFSSWRQGTTLTVDDFRLSIHAASLGAGDGPKAATERSAFAAAVVPLRQGLPTYPNERLSKIDRAFFGPFFREKYGTGGDKALENRRIRYYGPVQPATDAGELAGRRYVHEFDTLTGFTRGWHETLDRTGHVRHIRPERRDGAVRHYQFDGDGRYIGSW
jgi:hypothetical protein